MTVTLEHRNIKVQGIRLHTVLAGPVEGPLAILLHGFPEYWKSMEAQIIALAEAGYRVVAPDQRGYNLSDKPEGFDAYTLDILAKDILGLMDALGREKAFVAGHDWGAAVTWWLALKHPERIERAVTMSVPHPTVMFKQIKSNFSQTRRSWYMFFFQLPWLPEKALGAQDGKRFAESIKSTGHPGTFKDEELQDLREAWRQPGAMTGMLNWYRAAFRCPSDNPVDIRIRVPMMLIWGCKDKALGEVMADLSIELCDQGRLEKFPDATHWIQYEEPEKVNALILEWFDAS